MLRPWVFVGFTGHRDLPASNPEFIGRRIREALVRIEAHTGGPLAAISSAAKGADTLFVEAVQERNWPWFLLLPFPEDEFFNNADFDHDRDALARARHLASRATGRYIEPRQAGGAEVARNAAFEACSFRTVDECDVLVAVWKGPEQDIKRGGTSATVLRAREQGKPLIWIHAETGQMVEEGLSELPKDRKTNEPSTASAPLAQAAGADGLEVLKRTLLAYDEKASDHGPKARELLSSLIWMHLLGTSVGLIAPVFDALPWYAGFELPWLGGLALLVVAPVAFKLVILVIAAIRGRRLHHLKEEWLHHRIVAELCRSAVGTWPLHHASRAHEALIVPGFREWQRTLSRWHLFSAAPGDTQASKQEYLEHRLRDQLKYFRGELAKAKGKLRWWRPAAKYATPLAILSGVAAVIMGWKHGEHSAAFDTTKAILKYLSLILPLAAGWAFSWLVSQDYGRRVARNGYMIEYLEAMERRLQAAATREVVDRLVAESETMLLLEVLEFNSVSRFASEEH